MHRPDGVSGFSSISGFLGDKPTKRPRIQEPEKQMITDMRLSNPEVEDEVWDDLDEDAMEECMILATQMCTTNEPPKESVAKDDSRVNPNLEFKSPSRRDDKGNDSKAESSIRSHNNRDHAGDSGFSSSRGIGLDSSKIFTNSVKRGNSSINLNKSSKSNAYANRFSDFTSLENPQRSLNGLRSSSHAGKVYNSIPVKGNEDDSQANSNVKCVARGLTSDDSKHSEQSDTKLREDIIMKQGEISMLRADLQRKEAALESERLDRYAAIEAAEKKVKEKATAAALEAETKVKECNKMIEKLQDELYFKNHELKELESQYRRLKQTCQPGVSSSQRNRKDLSMKVSPGKSSSSFKDRFDFGVNSSCKKNVQVQTDCSTKVKIVRPKLNVSFSKGKGHAGRQVACFLSSVPNENESSLASNRWALDDDWSAMLSKAIVDFDAYDDVQNQLLYLSIQRLKEVLVMFSCQRTNPVRPTPLEKTSDPVSIYESYVVPALSYMKCVTSVNCKDLSKTSIEVICSHLCPLSYKDEVINSGTSILVLQALSHISSISYPQMDLSMCEVLLQRLKEYCKDVDTSEKLIAILQALQGLSLHNCISNNLCSNEGNCLINKLCSLLCLHNHLLITTTLQDWLSITFVNPPDWLHSKCSCSSKLLAAFLKQIDSTLDKLRGTEGWADSESHSFLIPVIKLLHCWSTKDLSWWEKVASLPHYTSVMGAILNSAKHLQIDRQTVDLLCDLYEFDEKIFDSC